MTDSTACMGGGGKVEGCMGLKRRWVQQARRRERTEGWHFSLVRALKPADHEVGEAGKMVWERARCSSQRLG